jgi:hypothetical protein
MKCLLFETKEIELRIESIATRPKNIEPESSLDDYRIFKNVIVVWLCIENEDTIKDANVMINEIVKYHEMVAKRVVITPFFHLSSNASINDDFNKKMIGYVSSYLNKMNILEGKLGYGFHRAIYGKWFTFGNNVSVAFRDSKFKSK